MPNNQDSPRFNIPANITRDHIIQAIKEIDANGYSEKNASRKYDLLYNGKRYPPKVVISLANKFANGTVLDFSDFSGGEQFTNKFLKERDFEIVIKNEEDYFEYESYSWKIIANVEAIKQMDQSSFLHHGTGIPVEIRSFFNIDTMKVGDDRRVITLSLGTSNFSAHFEILNKNNPRTRLLWRSDFQHFIQSKFPEWVDYFHKHSKHDNSTPILKLQKTESTDKYLVFFEESEKPTLPDLYTHSSKDEVDSQSPIRENKISSEYSHRMQIWNHLQEHYKSTNVLPDVLQKNIEYIGVQREYGMIKREQRLFQMMGME